MRLTDLFRRTPSKAEPSDAAVNRPLAPTPSEAPADDTPSAIEIIREHFDADYYRARYPKAVEGVEDVVEHYDTLGFRRRYNPCEWFDTRFYMFLNADVRTSGVNPFAHYLLKGKEEGRAPNEAAFIQDSFDRDYYLNRYPDVSAAGLDPIAHYLESGADEGRDPAPWFSTKDYLAGSAAARKAPIKAFAHYLAIGRENGATPKRASAAGPDFAEIFGARGVDPKAAEEELTRIELDVAERLASRELGEMVAKAASLDPLVQLPDRSGVSANIGLYATMAVPLSAAFLRVEAAAERRPARAAVLVPGGRALRRERTAAAVAEALSGIFGAEEVVVIATDGSNPGRLDRYPAGCRFVDLAGAIQSDIRHNDRPHLLFATLRALRVEIIVNVESNLFWRMLPRFGPALTSERRIFSYLFEPTIDEAGVPHGKAIDCFADGFDRHDGLLVEGAALAETLRERFAVLPEDAARLQPVETPARAPVISARVAREDDRDPQFRARVLWTGPLEANGPPELLVEVARLLPSLSFFAIPEFGPFPSEANDDLLENLRIAEDASAPGAALEAGDVWLHTSDDGDAAGRMIDLAASGLPLVALRCDGAPDLEGATLLDPEASAAEIAAAIEAALSDESAAQQANALRDRLMATYSPDAFFSKLKALVEEVRP